MSALSHMLNPRSIAVIGASATRRAQGNVVLANLAAAGYRGRVTVVHPTARSVAEVPAVPSIARLPGDVDVAVVCVPAASVAATLTELARTGCPAAITVAAGFTDGQDRHLRETLAGLDMAVGGPNCMGVIDVANGVPLYTARYRENLPAGRVAVIAQSGSAAIAVANVRGIGFSRIITSGNEYGVTAADYLSWLATDPDTDVVGVIAESVRDPRGLERAVRELRANGKSPVVLKVGRSRLGARATSAHTQAIVGADEAYTAFFDRLGVPTVADYDELGAALQCLSTSPHRAAGGRVGVISISGGQGALACDVAAETGIELAELAETTAAKLREILPGISGRNPLDLGASVGTRDRRQDALRTFAGDDGVDAVVVMQDAQDTLPIHPDHDYLPHVRQVVALGAMSDKPVVLVSNTGANTHPMIEEVVAGGPVPLLRGVRPGLAGLRTLLRRRDPAPPRDDADLTGCPSGAALEALRAEVRAAAGAAADTEADTATPLPREAAVRLLEAYGIPYARSAVVADEAGAVDAARRLGYPLVVKVVAAGLAHKTEAGGVAADVRDEASLRAAVRRVAASVAERAPEAVVEGFELQEFLPRDAEAVAGFTDDPALGPLVVLGTGGLLVELAADHSSSLAPLTGDDATRMIAATRLGRLLRGYRGILPPTDPAPLAGLTRRLGRLARDMTGLLAEGDLNPVVITARTGRATVVDALFIAR